MSEATGDDQAPAMRSAPTSEERGVVAGFAHNTVAANLVMAVMLIGGFAAVTQLTAQVFPTVDPGIVTVSVPYPGATPTEVAEGITRRVEEAVLGIDGVDRVVSKASENMGSVTVELKDFVDASRVRDDVESAVQQIADFPPEDAEEPDIVRAETISDVMTLVVSGALSEKELRRAAELVEEELLALPAVTLVSLVGARDYEIAIEVREEALRCLDDLLSYLAAEPEAALPEGGTCGQLALAYLHDLQVAGRHAEYDFRWLHGDRQLQHLLEHYRVKLEPAAPPHVPMSVPARAR